MSDFVKEHGALSVKNGRLIGAGGKEVRLFGMSTHGLAWHGRYVCEETFKALRHEWHTNCIRLALYSSEYRGYCTGGDRKALKALVSKGVRLAVRLGMYVIIDWHVLSDKDPLVFADEAELFFDEFSRKYAGVPNVIYEICNEPNGETTWESIKKYADRIIPVIRRNSPGAVVIAGTPEWSQRIDSALEAPLGYDNVMYALHFYAATHKRGLRERLRHCAEAGLPVFVSECSLTAATGSGEPDFESGSEWLSLLDEFGIGFMCWSLCASYETSAVFSAECHKFSGWQQEDIKPTGRWFRERFIGLSGE